MQESWAEELISIHGPFLWPIWWMRLAMRSCSGVRPDPRFHEQETNCVELFWVIFGSEDASPPEPFDSGPDKETVESSFAPNCLFRTLPMPLSLLIPLRRKTQAKRVHSSAEPFVDTLKEENR